jgi:hypothetical protein
MPSLRRTIAAAGWRRDYWRLIDYGGLENDDAGATVDDREPFEPRADRVGISAGAGGMITLMNIFEHPRDYKVAYAGVPVSDLVARMGYRTMAIASFSAPYHLGKTAADNVAGMPPLTRLKRGKLQTPPLIHSTTNDGDVNVPRSSTSSNPSRRRKTSSTRFTPTRRAATLSTGLIRNWRKNRARRSTVFSENI